MQTRNLEDASKLWKQLEAKYSVSPYETDEGVLCVIPFQIEYNHALAEEGRLYLYPDGRYISRHNGKIYSGSLLKGEFGNPKFDMTGYPGNISTTDFINSVLNIAAKRGHIQTGLSNHQNIQNSKDSESLKKLIWAVSCGNWNDAIFEHENIISLAVTLYREKELTTQQVCSILEKNQTIKDYPLTGNFRILNDDHIFTLEAENHLLPALQQSGLGKFSNKDQIEQFRWLVATLPRSEQVFYMTKKGNVATPGTLGNIMCQAGGIYMHNDQLVHLAAGARDAHGLARFGLENYVRPISSFGKFTREQIEGGAGGDKRLATLHLPNAPYYKKIHKHVVFTPMEAWYHDYYHSLLMSLIPKNIRNALMHMVDVLRTNFGEKWSKEIWTWIDAELSYLLSSNDVVNSKSSNNKIMPFNYLQKPILTDLTPEQTTDLFCRILSFGHIEANISANGSGLFVGNQMITPAGILIFIDMIKNVDKWKSFNIKPELLLDHTSSQNQAENYRQYLTLIQSIYEMIKDDEPIFQVLKCQMYFDLIKKNKQSKFGLICEYINTHKNDIKGDGLAFKKLDKQFLKESTDLSNDLLSLCPAGIVEDDFVNTIATSYGEFVFVLEKTHINNIEEFFFTEAIEINSSSSSSSSSPILPSSSSSSIFFNSNRFSSSSPILPSSSSSSSPSSTAYPSKLFDTVKHKADVNDKIGIIKSRINDFATRIEKANSELVFNPKSEIANELTSLQNSLKDLDVEIELLKSSFNDPEVLSILKDNNLKKQMYDDLEKMLATHQASTLKLEQFFDVNKLLKEINHIVKNDELKKHIIKNIGEISDFYNAKLGCTELTVKTRSNFIITQRIIKMISILSKDKGNLLTKENIDKVFNYVRLCEIPDDAIDKLLLLHQNIEPVSSLELLVQSNLDAILKGEHIEKSCDARLNGGLGLEEVANKEKQVTWGYYCVGVETKIVDMIVENKSLEEIYDYASKARSRIAYYREEDECVKFGKFRSQLFKARDFYHETEKSVASSKIFPSLSEVIKEIYPDILTSQSTSSSVTSSSIFQTLPLEYTDIIPINDHICPLPSAEIKIKLEKDKTTNVNKIVTIETSPSTFKDDDEIRQIIKKLDAALFHTLKKKNPNEDEVLSTLGELTYYLSRLYPFTRGSGAITQWIIRSVIKFQFDKEIGDIRLGMNRDIPYDIYAHIVKDKNKYIEEFKKSIRLWLHPNQTAVASSASVLKIQ